MMRIALTALFTAAMTVSTALSAYRDGRPEATLRMDAKDQGVVLRHGDGPDRCDMLGARDVWVFEADGTYYMHYDAAGPNGWLCSLAVSKDLVNWEKKGPILDFGQPGEDDSKSASYGVTYRDGEQWHMFYLGTPNVSSAPNLVPSFPYLTMKARAAGPTGPWIKQKDVVPFRTKADTYYSITASPGQTIKHGEEYLQFFSATTRKPGNPYVQRTLGIARTKNLDGPWTVDPRPMVPIEEQIENSTLYYEKRNRTWFLFTNHIGVDRGEYTDAVWVYWSTDPNRWDPKNKAVVLDGQNCTWSKKCIGLPSVVRVGDRLALFYDAPGGGSTSHMRRNIGLAWLDLPLMPSSDDQEETKPVADKAGNRDAGSTVSASSTSAKTDSVLAAEEPLAQFYKQPARFVPHPPAEGRRAEWFLKKSKNLKLDATVYHGKREERAKSDEKLPYRYCDATSRPALPFDKIVFIKRFTYHSSHFYTDFLDGCSRFGGNISILDLETGDVKDLFPQDSEMAGGIFGRFTLSFDAKRLVFDWKKAPAEGFRIFEVNIDGTGLRQLTCPPNDEKQRVARYSLHTRGGNQKHYFHQTDDMQPCYAPDDSIIFTSTRPQHGVLCSSYLTAPLIHRMDADGSNIQKLTNSAVSEFSPAVMPDGWITYSRWEYVDKGQLGIKCLWAMKPDGSGSKEIYGNDIPFPPTMLHGRPIPGEPNQFVMLGTPHFPQSGIGTVITVDTSENIRSRDPMHFVTWWVDIRQEPGWNHFLGQGWMRHGNGPLYMDPHPLAEDLFLVSHNRDRAWNDPTAYELMLLDDSGNHWPLLASDDYSLWQPTPLLPTRRPPVVPSTLDPELAKKGLAVCFVQDIYHGMEGIEPGEVKFIRILEQLPRPWSCRRLWKPAQNEVTLISPRSVLAGKVLRGVVPVEDDGSAHFYVPAGRNIYFEALDENYQELQRERTYVNYMPGERRACIGCHETPQDAPSRHSTLATAYKRAPVHPQPQPGDRTAARPIHYVTDVQPVLDQHCVQCHGGETRMAGIDLRGELTSAFSRSYETLLRYVTTTDEGSDWGGSEYLPAKSVGSHASRLMKQINKGCTGMEETLPLEDLVKIATWVDANAVYYGAYWGRIRIEHRDHPNFRPVPTLEDALATEPPIPWDER